MPSNVVRNRYLEDGAGSVPQPRLLIMVYDKLVLDLDEASAAIPAQQWETVNYKLQHAQAIILELHSALDKGAWTGGDNLGELYTWFDEQITLANVRKDVKYITPTLNMIRDLRDTWKSAYEQVLNEQAAARATVGAPIPAVAPA